MIEKGNGLANQVKTVSEFWPANYMNYLKKVEKSPYILVGHLWRSLYCIFRDHISQWSERTYFLDWVIPEQWMTEKSLMPKRTEIKLMKFTSNTYGHDHYWVYNKLIQFWSLMMTKRMPYPSWSYFIQVKFIRNIKKKMTSIMLYFSSRSSK
jgi:hypothetical protein